MLEPCVNQAAGLQALALQHPPRLVTVVSHGRQAGELPLLWGLCNCWVELDLSVLVLDAHAQESPDNPGLAQWLDNPLQRAGNDFQEAAWQVLPATHGLRQLTGLSALQNALAHLPQQRDVVLIYADAATLARLFSGCSVAPLIVVPPALSATVSAYAALKQLLQNQLRPGVANLVPESISFAPDAPTVSMHHLSQYASIFLGYHMQPSTVIASPQPIQARQDLQHLALQLFENALPLVNIQRNERVH